MDSPRMIDSLGKRCKSCRGGFYGIRDKLDAQTSRLHCDKCGAEIWRWSKPSKKRKDN